MNSEEELILIPELDDSLEEDLESHFIIRFPLNVAERLHEKFTADNFGENLIFNIDENFRYGQVQFEDLLLNAKIVDLPTITESMISDNCKTFYKKADISQMMICELPKECIPPVENEQPELEKTTENFLWPHGITPPLKNVRKNRFLKIVKPSPPSSVEQELLRLLEVDAGAEKVEYEILMEDPEKWDNSSDSSTSSSSDDEERIDEEFLFGRSPSVARSYQDFSESERNQNDFKELELDLNNDCQTEHNEKLDCKQQLQDLEEKYVNLQRNYQLKLKKVDTLPNPTLRSQMEASLCEMRNEMEEIKQQIQTYETALMKQQTL